MPSKPEELNSTVISGLADARTATTEDGIVLRSGHETEPNALMGSRTIPTLVASKYVSTMRVLTHKISIGQVDKNIVQADYTSGAFDVFDTDKLPHFLLFIAP